MKLRATVILFPLLCRLAGAAAAGPVDNAPPPRPIPDPLALVQEVEAHQRQLDELRENFTYREVQETDELDAKGTVTGHSSEEHEVFFVNRHRIARLVKKDGKPLTGRDEKNERDRVTRVVEKATKEPLDRDSYREGGQLELSRILAVMNISNPRRLMLNGRSTLTYDFTGDRHASSHGIALNAAKKMSGTVWFDEADRQVARLEASFDDNFRIGGGLLAIIQKGSFLRLEQSHAGQGLWLPSTGEVHVAARALMVKGVRQNIHIRDSDFRRFDIGMTQKTGEPK